VTHKSALKSYSQKFTDFSPKMFAINIFGRGYGSKRRTYESKRSFSSKKAKWHPYENHTLAVAANYPCFDTLFGTLPKMLGKGTHIMSGCGAGHGDSVAGRQHKRLDPCDRGNRLLSRLPTPSRVPWRSGEDLLVSPNTPQQKTPQGIEVHGHKGIARNQDAVTGPEEGNMARRVARRGNALPIRKAWETSAWIKRARDILETRLRKHRLPPPPRQSAHHRQDDPPV
jgi:hypothetical protein